MGMKRRIKGSKLSYQASCQTAPILRTARLSGLVSMSRAHMPSASPWDRCPLSSIECGTSGELVLLMFRMDVTPLPVFLLLPAVLLREFTILSAPFLQVRPVGAVFAFVPL